MKYSPINASVLSGFDNGCMSGELRGIDYLASRLSVGAAIRHRALSTLSILESYGEDTPIPNALRVMTDHLRKEVLRDLLVTLNEQHDGDTAYTIYKATERYLPDSKEPVIDSLVSMVTAQVKQIKEQE